MRKPSQRQIVFNWIMGETLSRLDGYWGGKDEVASVDELLLAVNRASEYKDIMQYLTDYQKYTRKEFATLHGEDVAEALDALGNKARLAELRHWHTGEWCDGVEPCEKCARVKELESILNEAV